MIDLLKYNKQKVVIYMLKETLVRIAVIIIIAIILNIVFKKTPTDSNTQRLIRKWSRIITNVTTVLAF